MNQYKLFRSLLCPNHIRKFCLEGTSRCGGGGDEKKGIILGVYEGEGKEPILTKTASKFNDSLNGKLIELIVKANKYIPKGEAKLFNNVDKEIWAICAVGLGPEKQGYNELEAIDEGLESVRVASGLGVQRLEQEGVTQILVDGLCNPEQAAEGSALALWRYQENKMKEKQRLIPTLELYDDPDTEAFQKGLYKAEAQNLARRLSDTPANQMTPLNFAQETINELCPCGIKVQVRDKEWIEHKKFNCFLNVARGSCEPPIILEISYCGGPPDQPPILFCGKGITYDSGGLCLKQCNGMDTYRADMTGAAAIISAIKATAVLNLPINIEAIIPLCENMTSGMAMKSGDIVYGMNGKSIMITDTDNEGRLLLADAFVYGQYTHKPRLVIDVASLTPDICVTLGSGPSGVFCNSETLWKQVRKSGVISGDRVWRMPLWNCFTKKTTEFRSHDVNNKGLGKGGPCLAAAFLNEFIDCVDWIHFDTTGVGFLSNHKIYPYLTKGRMTGRPTRTLIQLLHQLACPAEGQREF